MSKNVKICPDKICPGFREREFKNKEREFSKLSPVLFSKEGCGWPAASQATPRRGVLSGWRI